LREVFEVGDLFTFAEPASYMPWLILFAEAVVVTLSTLRTIFIAQGKRTLAPILGFFEVSIWLFAIGEVMKNLTDWRCSLAFAGGFTAGNFLGILIEQTLAMGSVMVQTITPRDPAPLVQAIRASGYGVTCLPGQGATGAVHIILSVVPRRELAAVKAILNAFDPELFFCVDGLNSTTAGVGPAPRRGLSGFVPMLPDLRRQEPAAMAREMAAETA
jgi:uncharacterized protein YebE (UPF0316 family)